MDDSLHMRRMIRPHVLRMFEDTFSLNAAQCKVMLELKMDFYLHLFFLSTCSQIPYTATR